MQGLVNHLKDSVPFVSPPSIQRSETDNGEWETVLFIVSLNESFSCLLTCPVKPTLIGVNVNSACIYESWNQRFFARI